MEVIKKEDVLELIKEYSDEYVLEKRFEEILQKIELITFTIKEK